jgi:hypothetical protein
MVPKLDGSDGRGGWIMGVKMSDAEIGLIASVAD